jgi:hypothetical protein
MSLGHISIGVPAWSASYWLIAAALIAVFGHVTSQGVMQAFPSPTAMQSISVAHDRS